MLEIKNNDSILKYTGEWIIFKKLGEDIKASETKGSYVEFSFTGTKFRFFTHANSYRGIAKIYIDGEFIKYIDAYTSNGEILDYLAFESNTLPYEEHTIKIEVSGDKNSNSKSTKIAIYRFEIDNEKLQDNNEEYLKLLEENKQLKSEIDEIGLIVDDIIKLL